MWSWHRTRVLRIFAWPWYRDPSNLDRLSASTRCLERSHDYHPGSRFFIRRNWCPNIPRNFETTRPLQWRHYSPMASQITSLTIVYSIVYSGANQRKHQSSASLAFVRGIHRWPVNSSHKGPVTRKIFPFEDVIMTMPMVSTLPLSYLPGKFTADSLSAHYIVLSLSRFISLILTHWGRDKMVAILQMTVLIALPSKKIRLFWFKFHCNLFVRVHLTITQHCFI